MSEEFIITPDIIENTARHYWGEDKLAHFVGKSLVKLHQGSAFKPIHSQSGTITARYYLKHNKLDDWQIKKWVDPTNKVNRLGEYASVLNRYAIEERKKKPVANNNKIFGKNFVITGTLSGGTRAEASDAIVKAGGFVQKQVTIGTHYLIKGSDGDWTQKDVDAQRLGTTVIDESTFRQMMKESGYIWFS